MDVQYTEEALFVGSALVIICKRFPDRSEFVQSKLRYGSWMLSKNIRVKRQWSGLGTNLGAIAKCDFAGGPFN